MNKKRLSFLLSLLILFILTLVVMFLAKQGFPVVLPV